MTASHRGSRRRGTEPTSSGSRTPAAPQPTTPKGGNPRSRHEPRPTPMTADYKSHDNHDDSRTPDNARNCPSRVVFCLVTRFAAESGPSWLAHAARRSRNPLKRGRFRGGIAAATCSHPSGTSLVRRGRACVVVGCLTFPVAETIPCWGDPLVECLMAFVGLLRVGRVGRMTVTERAGAVRSRRGLSRCIPSSVGG